jgi:hypothetical protein
MPQTGLEIMRVLFQDVIPKYLVYMRMAVLPRVRIIAQATRNLPSMLNDARKRHCSTTRPYERRRAGAVATGDARSGEYWMVYLRHNVVV